MAKLSLLSKVFVSIAIATCMVVAKEEAAHALTLTFDDLRPFELPPNGYGGLNWNNFWRRFEGDYYLGVGPGFDNGTISGDTILYNGVARPAEVSMSSGTFTFNSAYLTAGSIDGLTVTVEGFLDQTRLFSRSLTVNTTDPLLVIFDWNGINRLRFVSSGNGEMQHFVMDNFTLNEPTNSIPTPALLPGLVGLGFSVLRRRTPKPSCTNQED